MVSSIVRETLLGWHRSFVGKNGGRFEGLSFVCVFDSIEEEKL